MAEGVGLENQEAVTGAKVRILLPAFIGDLPSGKARVFDALIVGSTPTSPVKYYIIFFNDYMNHKAMK